MSFDGETLYKLLPQVYRSRDRTGQLRALVEILAEQAQVLEEDLDRLYDNHFIETCEEWVVPYLGALIGWQDPLPLPTSAARRRNDVANTLRQRRRKGTAVGLESLARDVMDCDATVVEFFRCLASTQSMSHLRPGHQASVNLRDRGALDRIGTPFERTARTVDVRRIRSGRGRYNIPNIGVLLWTSVVQSHSNMPARRVRDGCFTFDPLGLNVQLVTMPPARGEVSQLSTPWQVPLPISRQRLRDGLPGFVGAPGLESTASISIRLGDRWVLPISGRPGPIPAPMGDRVRSGNLSDVVDALGQVVDWADPAQEAITIDPMLGRLRLPQGMPPPAEVRVSYSTAAGWHLGGGEYHAASESHTDAPIVFDVARGDSLQQRLQEACAALSPADPASGPTPADAVLLFQGDLYDFSGASVHVPAGKTLILRAEDRRGPVLTFSEALFVTGGEDSSFVVDGLKLDGANLCIPAARPGTQTTPETSPQGDAANLLARLTLLHCTVLPLAPREGGSEMAPQVRVESTALSLRIEHSITGPLWLNSATKLSVQDSIIDAGAPQRVALAGTDGVSWGPQLVASNVTIIGRCCLNAVGQVENAIFHGRDPAEPDDGIPAVRVDDSTRGCMRFCYLPVGSVTPQTLACQPADVTETQRLFPTFRSLSYGNPGYGRLSGSCAPAISQGASDGSEMGAFHDLYLPQRLANLRTQLVEFTPFGLEVGILIEN